MSDPKSGCGRAMEKQWFGLAERFINSAEECVTLVRELVKQKPAPQPEANKTIPVDDLAAAKARSVLAPNGELLTRKEAAKYTRRSVAQFDKTLRPHLRRTNSARRSHYFKSEIDKCLEEHALPGRSGAVPERLTIRRALPIGASVSRNPQAQATLLKLRKSLPSSTKKF